MTQRSFCVSLEFRGKDTQRNVRTQQVDMDLEEDAGVEMAQAAEDFEDCLSFFFFKRFAVWTKLGSV